MADFEKMPGFKRGELQKCFFCQRRSRGSISECGFGAGADSDSKLPASFLTARSRKLPVGSNFSFAFLYFASQPVSFSLLA